MISSMSKMETFAATTPEWLWRQRFTSFARESLAYWRDVGRSGFVLVLVAALLGGAYEYGVLLKRLPPDFPYLAMLIVVLAPTLACGSMRTLVKPADRVFLMPFEARLGSYFRRAFAYSYAVQAAKATAALVAVWPLYARFGGTVSSAGLEPAAPQAFGWMLATALALKALHLFAAWHESRLVSARLRALLTAARLLTAAALVPLWFAAGVEWAWLASTIAAMLWVFLLYNSRKFAIGWDCLLDKEAAQQRRLYRWFRSFADVPQLPAPVRRRRWLAVIGRRLAVRQDNTFAYLYEKSLLRSELFGMYGRMCLVGIALVWLLSDLWLKSLFLLGIPLFGLVQLSTLADAHRYTFWLELYPVPRRHQASAVLGLVARLAVAQAALLSAAFALSAGHAGVYAAAVPPLSLAAVLLALRFRLRPALQRRFEGSA